MWGQNIGRDGRHKECSSLDARDVDENSKAPFIVSVTGKMRARNIWYLLIVIGDEPIAPDITGSLAGFRKGPCRPFSLARYGAYANLQAIQH
jgi:hypothetical protein